MSLEKRLKTLVKPDDQDRNVFNTYKRFLKDLPKLTPEQLAILHFEVFHEARNRGAMFDGEEHF